MAKHTALTKEIAVDAGEALGSRRMRAQNRAKWNGCDLMVAALEQARICLHLGGNEERFARAYLSEYGGKEGAAILAKFDRKAA
jgi:hypothetical protein